MAMQSRTGTSPPSSLRGLIVLNAVLLMVLAAVTFGSASHAQQRLRGEYAIVAGGVNGLQAAAAYIVDVINQEMIAITYNPNTKSLDGIGYRNLAVDEATVTRRRPGN